MKNKWLLKSVRYGVLAFFLLLIQLSQGVDADTISAGSGNRIHFINTKAKSGSDAILLESNGHYALIDMGEDYDFPDGSDPRYPSRWGISMRNNQVLEDRLIRHLDQIGVKKLDFILGTHVHSDHIGGADEILNRYQVGKFYLKKYSDDRITSHWGLWDNLFNYDNALRAAQKRGVTLIQNITDEDSHFKLGDMDIQLYNYKNEYDADGNLKRVRDDNSNSIVSVVTVAGKRIYLGGDLDNAEGAEDKLGPVIGKVDMMKWNHHYDATISNTINFLENLSPKMVIQTTGGDINVASTREYLQKKNIQVLHAASQTQDATVFDISDKGFANVSNTFPDIPVVDEKWYQEDGYWKYRLTDGEMAIGWREIGGATYFFNGKGQMQAGRWLHLNDDWGENAKGNDYYLNQNGKMQTGGWFKLDDSWYYIQSNGARRFSELSEIGGKKYLFAADGKMLTGHQVYNGKKMFFSESGALQAAGKPSTWQKIDSDWYFYDEDGLKTVGKKIINGSTYYFNQEGVMQTGWTFVDGYWNYFANSGAMKTGWVKDQETWYYLDKDGIMLTGSQDINGVRYYLNASGAMQTGWAFVDGHWNYFASSGAMKTGWIKDQETWYYLDKDGIMLTGSQDINGVRYYLNASGAMQTGWAFIDGHWNYFASSGVMKTGWLKDNESWYYLDPETGIMAVGSKEIDGKNYFFSSAGTMQVGWQWSNDSWHYYATSGALQTGWLKDGDAWYYLEGKEGVMLVGLHQVDGKQYYFSKSGAMQTGWKWFDNHYRYFESNGAMKTGWIKDKGVWYYLNPEDGIMLVGLHKVNGDHYYFDESGAMQTGWKQLDGNWYYFQADGSLLKNATTPDGYKVNEEGIWKQAVAAVNSEAVKPEQKQEANSSIVEQPKQDSNLEANASEKKEKE
ncbi:MBL fold metallo-hydrolase [Streptococcus oralis]|uniref:MBL fold metallo-hydrolase n=1 Tax=Streptococcus oralis subsp. tigurinus TaxID=1077464 RepID=A0AAX0N6Z3_STROR|nr:MBL fold metallo-hydrolase [Streptococcus oralis]MBS3688449.1 MBL fold metallo-hydrolase [Streptococcus oralis]MCY7082299.1 MBL fold metallo-hydrolase [Streptococcus oralis]MCY7105827.1 MBL fold metallo-hydrolase [Streptococcus oralis]ORO34048.1 MBL fold metallo-hydrolase [Streptococcus oralis subsp. tigurinus]